MTRGTRGEDALPSRAVGFATPPVAPLLDPAGFAAALAEATRSVVARPLPAATATAELAAAAGLAALRALGGDRPTDDHPWFALLRAEHDVLARHLRGVVADVADDPQLSPPARRKLEFLAEQVVAATAPEHWPWSNPAVLRTALDTGGRSLLRGARNALRDLVTGGGVPRQTPPDALLPGRDLAVTPGSVVFRNRLAEGKLELAGERLDLGAVCQDAYVVGAVADHVTPWAGVYAGARLLGGSVRFVLTTAGHIAGVVNPPDPDSRRRYRTDAPLCADPVAWQCAAVERPGSWWPDWAEWLGSRAGDLLAPPPTGSPAHPPLEPAPGRYVLEP